MGARSDWCCELGVRMCRAGLARRLRQGDSPDELDPGKLLWHPLFDLRGSQLSFHDRGKDAHQNSEIERQTNVTATLNLKINKFIWQKKKKKKKKKFFGKKKKKKKKKKKS